MVLNFNILFYKIPNLLSSFCARKMFLQSDLRAWKTILASPPHMKSDVFQVYFSSSARFIGHCAEGSLLARGRSSACHYILSSLVQLQHSCIFLIFSLSLFLNYSQIVKVQLCQKIYLIYSFMLYYIIEVSKSLYFASIMQKNI